ncbi:MAG: ATPase, partial [Blastochloris sp.]|nr:ATPase [Blastochloris sp.]
PDCCGDQTAEASCHSEPVPSTCCSSTPKGSGLQKLDWLLWGSLLVISLAFVSHFFHHALPDSWAWAARFSHGVYGLVHQMWWGLALGILALGLLSRVPRELVMGLLGQKKGMGGLLRAIGAGLLLDLCNHGILFVGMKLYERGASIGQVIAFLVASPWNSLSLTLILWSLIGLKWTLAFLLGSALIALITGRIFDLLVDRGVLPPNPNRHELPADFSLKQALASGLKGFRFSWSWLGETLKNALLESRMILRWVFFGIVVAALIQALVPADFYQNLFGPTLAGLFLTLLAATVIEVCSEGSTPISADLFNRAGAPGGAFTFLMAGAATDYTEIMALKETTRSWKISLFLPLTTVPQVLLLGWLMNHFSVQSP